MARHTTQCVKTEQTSQATECSAFWKGILGIFPHPFLQHTQRLIGNRKTAAIRAAGPDGEPVSEPALRFSFLLTQVGRPQYLRAEMNVA